MRKARIVLAESVRSIVENLEGRRLLSSVGLEMDFGDAPDTYRTLLISNGPHHVVTPNLLLGAVSDAEPDGQPSPNADRDDLSGTFDDEDGVLFISPISPGMTADVQVTNGPLFGVLNAWVDFNLDGVFGFGEHVLNNVLLPGFSVTVQSFFVPATAGVGVSYARFRLTETAMPQPTPEGFGGPGEVEDYRIGIVPPVSQGLDYGDAPDSYRTRLAVNGARHTASNNIRLGAANVDAEPDGQPSPNADRDDLNGNDDEDGVIFLTPLVQGSPATVQVTNGGGAARLNAWMDFNGNGVFDPAEQIFTNHPMPALSVNMLSFLVPSSAATGVTYSRWRVNAAGGLQPFGFGGVGEVEDYLNRIEQATPAKLDFGDAPDTYGTTLAANGARHGASPNLRLGALVDAEPDGQPTALADGDDLAGVDDEDGVVIGTLTAGSIANVQVTNGAAAGRLNAWVDFNADGVFGAGEQIFTNLALAAASVNNLTFLVPAGATPGITYARFRLNANGGIGPTGPGGIGEVEDYQIRIQAPPQLRLDFGDAPDSLAGPFLYPTLLGGASGNPARHVITGQGPILGNLIDAEPDGQPNLAASGDDLTGVDDEDGVAIGGVPLELVPLTLGSVAPIQVTNGGNAPGLLNAWFDFSQNGAWEPGEQVAFNIPIPAMTTIVVNIPIPNNLNPQLPLYSRFRIATQGGLQPTGAASNGEVEDYASKLRLPPPAQLLDFGDAPEIAGAPFSYPTTLGGPSGNPARHVIVTAGPRLGNRIDPEPDGQPTTAADGDDQATIDDEDGVFVGGSPLENVPLVPGAIMVVQVSNPTGVAGLLNAWFDWNQNGGWEPAEQVALDLPAGPGITLVPVPVPLGLPANSQVYSRWRISTTPGLQPTGPAPDGEVEDYVQRVRIDTTPPFVIAHRLEFETSQSLLVEFSEDIDPASVQLTDIRAFNTDDGSIHSPVSVAWVYQHSLARFTFNAPGLILPDGDYEFDLANMSDLAGNLLLPAVQLGGPDTFWKAGDANRDRTTNIGDFSLLAANFNRTGTFSHGDFNYNGTTEIGDFAILASRFNTVLPGGVARSAVGSRLAPMPGTTKALFGATRLIDELEPDRGTVI